MPMNNFGKNKKNSIGFLRLFLASLVVYSHSYYLGGFGDEPLSYLTHGKAFLGGIAVPAFFVISGILITESYMRCDSLYVFIWHRALRLLPALWICLVVTAFFFAVIISYFSAITWSEFLTTKVTPLQYVLGNALDPRKYISIGTTLSSNFRPCDWNGSLWTLFYEASAYLIVAGMGVSGLLNRYRKIGIVIILIYLALFIFVKSGFFSHSGIFNFIQKVFNTKGKIMILHFLSGVLWVLIRYDRPLLKNIPYIFGVASFIALFAGLISGSFSLISPFALPPFLVFIADILPLKDFEKQVGGDYSYGLYVYGYPIQQILVFFGFAQFGILAFVLVSLLAALSFAFLSWHLIEKRALSYKNWKLTWSL